MNPLAQIRLLPALVVLLLAFHVPAVGLAAQPDSIDDLSKANQQALLQHIERGRDAYDTGEFERALSHFQSALKLYEHPDLLYRMALTHERLGHERKAIEFYRRFLERRPDAKERQKIERTIEMLETRAEAGRSRLKIDSQPSGAVLFIPQLRKNGPSGTTPVDLPVEPGTYTLRLRHDGRREIERRVEVGRGEILDVSIDLPAVPSTGAGGVDAGPGFSDVAPWVLVGIGGATGVAAIVTWANYSKRQNRIDTIDSTCKDNQCTRPDWYDQTFAEKESFQTAAKVTTAVAGVSLVSGGLWLAIHQAVKANRRSDGSTSRPAPRSGGVAPVLAPLPNGGALLQVQGQF